MTNGRGPFTIKKVNVLSRLNSVAHSAAAAVARVTTAPPVASVEAADAAAPTTTTGPATRVVDSYEQHLPTPTKLDGFADRMLSKVAPIRTHERVLHDMGGSFFGVQVGVTLSQLELAKRGTSGVEFIQVVNPDGSSNIETVLGRKQLGMGHRIELQGPALNTSLSPGELPVGARFIGVGLTTDVTSTMDHDALSYTVEVKLSEKSIAEFAAMGGPGAAALAADALADVAGTSAAHVVGEVLLGAVPVLSAVLAINSARRALHTCRDKTAPAAMKFFAVTHALADAVRIVFPLAGTLANAGLVVAAASAGYISARHQQHAAPTGERLGDPPEAPAPPVPPPSTSTGRT